jgi:hypothetical protein
VTGAIWAAALLAVSAAMLEATKLELIVLKSKDLMSPNPGGLEEGLSKRLRAAYRLQVIRKSR